MGFLSSLLGGGGGSSQGGVKSPVTTTTTETRAATGQSYADQGSQAISGFQLQDEATVHLTDLGAVKSAFEFTERTVKDALTTATQSNKAAAAAFENAQDRAGAVDADTAVKLGIIGTLLVAGILAYMTRRK